MKWYGLKQELFILVHALEIAAVFMFIGMIVMGVYEQAKRQEFEDQRKPFEQYIQEQASE